MFCTSLAIARRTIPACHYMIAAFGGTDVRCAEYATYGTKALSLPALKALEVRSACLLASHGAIATGYDLPNAMWRAVELETIAQQLLQFAPDRRAGNSIGRIDRGHPDQRFLKLRRAATTRNVSGRRGHG